MTTTLSTAATQYNRVSCNKSPTSSEEERAMLIFSKQDAPYKLKVERITDHKTDKLGVRFYTKWKYYKIHTHERSLFLRQKEGGRQAITDYISKLEKECRTARLKHMFRRQPTLKEYVQESESTTTNIKVENKNQ